MFISLKLFQVTNFLRNYNQIGFDKIDFQIIKMTESQNVEFIYKRMIEIFSADPQKDKNMIIQVHPPRMTIKFNRPKRYNAFTMDMYLTFSQSIKRANSMDTIKFIVISGQGGNFSSGNDLTNFTNPVVTQLGDFPDVVKASSKVLKQLTVTIINSKKPIIAVTEGKVIGFAFTMLALLDKVFAVQSSSFTAPLVSSAQGPQLCASYTFPKIFGKSIAQQLVTFGKPVNADFLSEFNFLETSKSKQQAEQKLQAYLNKIDQLQWLSYLGARKLYKQRQDKILLDVVENEMKNLIERWLNPQLLIYIAKHMQKMKKAAKL